MGASSSSGSAKTAAMSDFFSSGAGAAAKLERPELLQQLHADSRFLRRQVRQRLVERLVAVFLRPGAKLVRTALQRVHFVVETAHDLRELSLALAGRVVEDFRLLVDGLELVE